MQESDSTVIEFTFSSEDLNEIKRNTDIYTDRTNAWITFTEYAITDMALIPNQVVEMPNTTVLSEGVVTEVFYPDLTDPVLWSFDLNLTSHQLILYFSETVLARTLNISQITLQSTRNRASDTQWVTSLWVSCHFTRTPLQTTSTHLWLISARLTQTESKQ